MLKRQTEQFPAAPQSRFSHAWRALRHRNFRLFFTGQSISLIGTWTTRVATSWLVYRLTRSALLLGTVSFAGQIPTCLLAPFRRCGGTDGFERSGEPGGTDEAEGFR